MRCQLYDLLFLCLCLSLLQRSAADVSELVRSGNGFVYDAPVVPTFELADVNNNFPAQEEFSVESLSTSASELLPATTVNVGVPYQQHQQPIYTPPQQPRGFGYQYQVPSRAFSGY